MSGDNIYGLIAALISAVLTLILFKRLKSSHKSVNPIGEAKVFIAYKRYDQAREILEKYLASRPDDQQAIELLRKINEDKK